MSTNCDFQQRYNNKDSVPTLETLHKMIVFPDGKGIDMLKLDSTLPNLPNTCLYKSTDLKSYPFSSSDSDLLEKYTGRYDRWSLNYFHQESSSKQDICSKIKQLF